MTDVDLARMLRGRGVRPRKRKRRGGLFTGPLLAILGGGLMGGLMWLCAVVAISGFFFDYSLMTIFAKDVPWYADCLAGVVTCIITVPVGIFCWVAVLCDVETPFVPGTPPVAEAPMDPTNG